MTVVSQVGAHQSRWVLESSRAPCPKCRLSWLVLFFFESRAEEFIFIAFHASLVLKSTAFFTRFSKRSNLKSVGIFSLFFTSSSATCSKCSDASIFQCLKVPHNVKMFTLFPRECGTNWHSIVPPCRKNAPGNVVHLTCLSNRFKRFKYSLVRTDELTTI